MVKSEKYANMGLEMPSLGVNILNATLWGNGPAINVEEDVRTKTSEVTYRNVP